MKGPVFTQLTDNDREDTSPRISGSNVVWLGHDGNDNEVFCYYGPTLMQLTDNEHQEKALGLSGSNVVWLTHDGNDEEVFLARIGGEAGVERDDKDAVAALKKMHAKLELNDEGWVTKVRQLSTDEGMALLKGLPRLKELYVEGFFVVQGQSGTAKFGQTSSVRVTDAGLLHLRELPKLQSLHLQTRHITDGGLAHLEELTALKKLTVAASGGMGGGFFMPEVTDAGLVHLKGLAKLKALNLVALRIDGSGLVHLKALPKLSRLSLSGSPIRDEGLVHLKDLPNLNPSSPVSGVLSLFFRGGRLKVFTTFRFNL